MHITITSIIKIMTPTFFRKISAKNWAIRSVPPVLVSYRSIIPIPRPTNMPPIMELIIAGNCIKEIK